MDKNRSIKARFANLAALGKMTVPYGGQTAYERFHPGVDIANAKGTPIPSMENGIVENTVTGKRQGDAGFGNTITVRTQNGDRHQFGHMGNVNVAPGQQVQKGQIIGDMSNSGSAYSPSGQGDGTHLDFRIVSAYNKYKNPMTYLRNIKY